MAQFAVNAHRFDPYKNFKFRLKWDGRYVAGVSKAGALKRSTEGASTPPARRAARRATGSAPIQTNVPDGQSTAHVRGGELRSNVRSSPR